MSFYPPPHIYILLPHYLYSPTQQISKYSKLLRFLQIPHIRIHQTQKLSFIIFIRYYKNV
ncbi:hypothetical protein HC081234_08360 [Helicobacter cinaedi]|nr:hypothetical protein HC081234_08360 [Helicobacter cinaedi]